MPEVGQLIPVVVRTEEHVETLRDACAWMGITHGRASRYVRLLEESLHGACSEEHVLAAYESSEIVDLSALWKLRAAAFRESEIDCVRWVPRGLRFEKERSRPRRVTGPGTTRSFYCWRGSSWRPTSISWPSMESPPKGLRPNRVPTSFSVPTLTSSWSSANGPNRGIGCRNGPRKHAGRSGGVPFQASSPWTAPFSFAPQERHLRAVIYGLLAGAFPSISKTESRQNSTAT